ncbi:MAG: hypothetical protein IJ831_04955 [Spirochaetales bacterium]|nr:hypothetical protein [Spirochaetales bacterium]
MNEFGKAQFTNTAYFNFDGDERLKSIFDHDFNIYRIISELETIVLGRKIIIEYALIIFDEEQECPRAIHSLKYFCENRLELCGRECVYFEKTYHDNYDPIRGVRTERYKYVINFDAQVLYDVRLLTAPRYRWFRFPYLKSKMEELYDLLLDPDETLNLAKREEYKEIRDKLRRNVAHHMKETNDPLLEGPMTCPYYRKERAEMFELSEK